MAKNVIESIEEFERALGLEKEKSKKEVDVIESIDELKKALDID